MRLTTLKPRLATLNTQRLMAQPVEVERLRGRAAVDRRTKWLTAHPLCVMCEAEGRVTAADVVDHIVPLWDGGQDIDSNLQSLCQTPHHDAKSKAEAAKRSRGG